MGFKNMFKKSSKFFDKEGFYIVLFVCLCIVAVAAVYISRNNANTVKKIAQDTKVQIEQQQPSNAEQVKEDVNSNNTVPTMQQPQNSTNTSSISTVKKDATDYAKKETSKQASSSAVNFKISSPVQGDTVKKFDKEELQESKTMQQWETHEGIDIAADLGTEVKAAQGGKIVDVYKDDAILQNLKSGFGITVVIDHGNGIRTMYSNLAEELKVKKGDTVKTGQVIGVVGDTAVREAVSIEGSHLHFVVLKKSGKEYVTVNPVDYLKK